MIHPQHTLLVYEDRIQQLLQELRTGTIRMAGDNKAPWAPLRTGKEVKYDETKRYVMPSRDFGISLAASLKQLDRIWKGGRENYLFVIDRSTVLPKGLAFEKENEDHWMIVVTEKMTVLDYMSKITQLAANWKALGRYIKHG